MATASKQPSKQPPAQPPKQPPKQPHDRINFNLRPAKRIERKLIAEALSCIYRYDTPRRFGYVGMGSYYFSDFILFHRVFGLKKMISIEVDTANQARFDFNKPFDCIEMAWGKTHDHLPVLPIFNEAPVICWLDYYDYLTDAIIGDAKTFVHRAQPGSALLITLKSTALANDEDTKKFLEKLDPVSQRLSANNKIKAQGPGAVAIYMTEILSAALEPTVADMNAGLDEAEEHKKLELRQIVRMMYRDAAPMVTIGWLLLNKAQAALLDAAPEALDAPAISLHGNAIYEVKAPVLTFREISHLKSLLPNGVAGQNFASLIGAVPHNDAVEFSKFYRYFPSFADVEE